MHIWYDNDERKNSKENVSKVRGLIRGPFRTNAQIYRIYRSLGRCERSKLSIFRKKRCVKFTHRFWEIFGYGGLVTNSPEFFPIVIWCVFHRFSRFSEKKRCVKFTHRFSEFRSLAWVWPDRIYAYIFFGRFVKKSFSNKERRPGTPE